MNDKFVPAKHIFLELLFSEIKDHFAPLPVGYFWLGQS